MLLSKNNLIEIQSHFTAKPIDPADNIYIFSDPRGGSTWLMNLLKSIPNTAVLWEPIHPSKGVLSISNNTTRPHISQFEKNISLFNKINDLFSGLNINSFIARSSHKEYENASSLIIKFVRANRMLPWLLQNFSFKYEPIHLLRHPIATSLSQCRAFFSGNIYSKDFPWNQNLFQEYLELSNLIRTRIDYQLAVWCIHNKYLLEKDELNIHVIHYENLLTNPIEEIKSLFEKWNIPVPNEIYSRINERSHTDFKNELRENTKDQLSKWRRLFSENDISHFQNILDYFQIRIYNTESDLPLL